ncbi:MAG: hypothetical protein L3J25_08915 [Flavobacteriaceae bacterium]|nr:hypothetical protein [Flavobacteriaceae bacterium]
MKNKLNLFLLISFLLALSLTTWIYYQTTNRVGDIVFDKSIDNATFKTCYDYKTPQYYQVGTNYQDGSKAIKKELSDTIENLTFEDSGYITFRFIINCNGEVGRFRVKTINSDLQENNFNNQKIKILQKSIESLKKWNPGMWKDKAFDSYFVLNFKVEKGKITDIF